MTEGVKWPEPYSFESAMSMATAGIGGLERLDMTPDQQVRLEQLCVRLMKVQRKQMSVK